MRQSDVLTELSFLMTLCVILSIGYGLALQVGGLNWWQAGALSWAVTMTFIVTPFLLDFTWGDVATSLRLLLSMLLSFGSLGASLLFNFLLAPITTHAAEEPLITLTLMVMSVSIGAPILAKFRFRENTKISNLLTLLTVVLILIYIVIVSFCIGRWMAG